ncbi:MAG: strawberry notch family protein [Muribaculum sp.]|nr:strawberry notch family protein [Muribaculum sp.]
MKYADNKNYMPEREILSLGATIPEQLSEETAFALRMLQEALHGDVAGYVANRLNLSSEELTFALATEQIDGIALAIYNIEARSQSVIIGDQTGIGKGRQAAAMIRYGMLAGYLPIFLTDRYTLFSDMYRDCKALGIKDARPLILNQKVSVVDFDNIIEQDDNPSTDEIWSPNEDDEDGQEVMGIYQYQYEVVYKSPQKSELEMMYAQGDIPESRYEYLMLTYSQLKDARKDKTRLDFLTSLCENHKVLFIFDEAHKSSSVTAGKISIITQCINAILKECPQTQCVFLSATFAKRPECLITFMRQTILSSLATNETLQAAFANGGVPMQEYVASKLAKEGQMIRREHSYDGIPEPTYTYLDDKLATHAELFDKVMYWFRELVKLSDMVKAFMVKASLLGVNVFKPYPTRSHLFYINKVLLLSLKAKEVAVTAVREVQSGKNIVIGMSDTLECILRDSIDSDTGECAKGDFSTLLIRLVDKTIRNPAFPLITVFDLDFSDLPDPSELQTKVDEIKTYSEQIYHGIKEDVFHLPMSPIDVIRQLITQESYIDKNGIRRNIRFEECTGRARQLEYLSPEGDDNYENATVITRKKRHTNHIFNDFQNNKVEVILINACGAIGASAHAIATNEVPEHEVRQRKMLIVQNDLDVNIDLQKRGRINRTGQMEHLPPLYEYIITAIPSEKRLNMMLRAKLRSLSANTTANQDQDKRQADFIDITNKYGNAIARDFIDSNQELAFILGLNRSATASQLLARISMLSVSAQQDIIDDVFSAYLSLEQELRRINQWDLEREHRDFEAEFVHEELFTASVDDTALGGASKLSTFLCHHRTFPYDSKALAQEIEKAKSHYGTNLIESIELNREIKEYYRVENKHIRTKFKARREKLWASTLDVLVKYTDNRERVSQLMLLSQQPVELWWPVIDEELKDFTKHERIKHKLSSYSTDYQDLDAREKKELKDKSQQRKRLMDVLALAVIGKGYSNIIQVMPVEDNIGRVIAVLKEIRFGKNQQKRFSPGNVQFVFALSAIRKELVLNLVNKGIQSNYARLSELLSLNEWTFNPIEWDNEIARNNNRIIERKIITGNILGAFANPLIQKIKPHFITFTLKPDEDGEKHIERGLLLPMAGENIEKLMYSVALPLGEGLKYANAINHVYQIAGIGIEFSITPIKAQEDNTLQFLISVNDKDSRKFEDDTRFDSIKHHFKSTTVSAKPVSKRPLTHYSTDMLVLDSLEFNEIISHLASLRAIIMIPREYITIGEMKEFSKDRVADDNCNWSELDWQNAAIMPPVRREVQIRITTPPLPENAKKFVEQISPFALLCKRTLPYEGHSLRENMMPGQIRALYYAWEEGLSSFYQVHRNYAYQIYRDLNRILSNGSKHPEIHFDNEVKDILVEGAGEELTPIGKIMQRYKEDFVFLAPDKDAVEKFIDTFPYSDRLKFIKLSLEKYLNGETDIIIEL